MGFCLVVAARKGGCGRSYFCSIPPCNPHVPDFACNGRGFEIISGDDAYVARISDGVERPIREAPPDHIVTVAPGNAPRQFTSTIRTAPSSPGVGPSFTPNRRGQHAKEGIYTATLARIIGLECLHRETGGDQETKKKPPIRLLCLIAPSILAKEPKTWNSGSWPDAFSPSLALSWCV